MLDNPANEGADSAPVSRNTASLVVHVDLAVLAVSTSNMTRFVLLFLVLLLLSNNSSQERIKR